MVERFLAKEDVAGSNPVSRSHFSPIQGDVAKSADVQRLFAEHHGQPARRETWTDPAIDARFGGCYSATLATAEACWTRPRFPGYLGFQAKAGDLIEQHLRGAMDEAQLLDRLQIAFEASGKR